MINIKDSINYNLDECSNSIICKALSSIFNIEINYLYKSEVIFTLASYLKNNELNDSNKVNLNMKYLGISDNKVIIFNNFLSNINCVFNILDIDYINLDTNFNDCFVINFKPNSKIDYYKIDVENYKNSNSTSKNKFNTDTNVICNLISKKQDNINIYFLYFKSNNKDSIILILRNYYCSLQSYYYNKCKDIKIKQKNVLFLQYFILNNNLNKHYSNSDNIDNLNTNSKIQEKVIKYKDKMLKNDNYKKNASNNNKILLHLSKGNTYNISANLKKFCSTNFTCLKYNSLNSNNNFKELIYNDKYKFFINSNYTNIKNSLEKNDSSFVIESSDVYTKSYINMLNEIKNKDNNSNLIELTLFKKNSLINTLDKGKILCLNKYLIIIF